MSAYYELREALANDYGRHTDWARAATESGVPPALIVLEGSSISAWSNILKAVRTHRQLPTLREFLSHNEPQLLPLFDRYARDVESGDETLHADHPALAGLELTDADLRDDPTGNLLSLTEARDCRLLALAFVEGATTFDAIDAQLSGTYTAAAQARLRDFSRRADETLSALKSRKSAASSKVNELQRQISEIQNAPLPQPPVDMRANYPADSTQDQRDRWNADYNKDVAAHKVKLERHKAARETLPALRASADAAASERKSLETEIANQRTRTLAEERHFLGDIEQSRDQDLLVAFDDLIKGTRAALSRSTEPLAGFWAMVTGSCALEVIVRIAANPATAAEASRRYHAVADGLARAVEENMGAIARACLIGPLVVHRELMNSRRTLAELGARLDQVDAGQLDERRRHARELHATAPEIPRFDNVEAPADIERIRGQLNALLTDRTQRLSRLETEVDEEPESLLRATEQATADGAVIVEGINRRGVASRHALASSRWSWQLIGCASTTSELPAAVRTLCEALPYDFARRTDSRLVDVLSDATRTNFALAEAQALIDGHRTTDYLRAVEALRRAPGEHREHLQQIEKALSGIEGRYDTVADSFRSPLAWVAVFAIVPIIGLFSAIQTRETVKRLQPLVSSDVAPYVELGDYAVRATAIAAVLAALGAAVAIVIALSHAVFSDTFDPDSAGVLGVIGFFVYAAASVVSAGNFRALRGYGEQRNSIMAAQRAPTAATE